MLKLVVLLSFVACGLGAVIPEGMVPQLDGRIVGGSETTIDRYPYQVSLQRNGAHSCGGSIYNERVIVTAAHCLLDVSASSLKVRAGSTSKLSGGTYVQVASFKGHDGYNAEYKMDDIGVVRLASPLQFGSEIASIALPTSLPNAGQTLVVTGWGATSDGGPSGPPNLKVAYVNYVTPQDCASSSYGYGDQIKYGMICAAAAGQDTCTGDSGGPLASTTGLVGVISWGFGCAKPRYPGVYTSVPVYRSWIMSNA